MAESKSVRKNRKRREAKKATGGFVVEEEIPVSKSHSPPPAPVDPLSALQTQLSEAKAAKDNVKAQELREKIWALNDITQLGRQPADAPRVDLGTIIQTTEKPKVDVTTGDPTEKKLLKLRKKLDQIQLLKERQERGEKLEQNQLAKIESQAEVEEEVKIIEDLLRTHTLT